MDVVTLRSQIATALADYIGQYTFVNGSTGDAIAVRREGEGIFPGTRVTGLEVIISAEPNFTPISAYRDQPAQPSYSVFLIGWPNGDPVADTATATEIMVSTFPGCEFQRLTVPENIGPTDQVRIIVQSYASPAI